MHCLTGDLHSKSAEQGIVVTIAIAAHRNLEATGCVYTHSILVFLQRPNLDLTFTHISDRFGSRVGGGGGGVVGDFFV